MNWAIVSAVFALEKEVGRTILLDLGVVAGMLDIPAFLDVCNYM